MVENNGLTLLTSYHKKYIIETCHEDRSLWIFETQETYTMLYELIILAQLMRQPAHGYLIAKIINDMIGPYAHVSNG